MARGSNKVVSSFRDSQTNCHFRNHLQAYLALLHFTLLPLADTEVLFCFVFHKLKVCGNPVSSHFPNHVGLLCVSLSRVGGDIFIIIVFTMLICYQWSSMLLLSLFWGFGNHAQVRWQTQLINVCVLTVPLTSRYPSSPSPQAFPVPETLYRN